MQVCFGYVSLVYKLRHLKVHFNLIFIFSSLELGWHLCDSSFPRNVPKFWVLRTKRERTGNKQPQSGLQIFSPNSLWDVIHILRFLAKITFILFQLTFTWPVTHSAISLLLLETCSLWAHDMLGCRNFCQFSWSSNHFNLLCSHHFPGVCLPSWFSVPQKE